MATTEWKALEISIPAKEGIQYVTGLLETLNVFLEVTRTILDLVKALLIGLANPILALAKALYALLLNAIESLSQTGLYSWQLLPDLRTDPYCKLLEGGYPNFVERWKGSLQDSMDLNRPQPVPNFNTGGFIMVVVDSNGIPPILKLIKLFSSFMDVKLAPYPAPVNLKAYPMDSDENPLFDFADYAIADSSDALNGVLLEWSNPTNISTPDSGYKGLGADLSAEFLPTKWLVEVSRTYPSERTKGDEKDGVIEPGIFYYSRTLPTTATDTAPTADEPAVDIYGQPVILMERTFVLDSFLGGLAGYFNKFRYTFKFTADQSYFKRGQTYYFRVRQFDGTPTITDYRFKVGQMVERSDQSSVYYYEPSGTDLNLGQPSNIIALRMPEKLPDFDVVECLRHVFLAAYSLNFQQPVELTVKGVDTNGNPVFNQPVFDEATGQTVPPYGANVLYGQGELVAESPIGAGKITPLQTIPEGRYTPDTAGYVDYGAAAPWVSSSFRLKAATMANQYAELLLQAGTIGDFQALVQGNLPYSFTDSYLSSGLSGVMQARTIEELVTSLTPIQKSFPTTIDPTGSKVSITEKDVLTFGHAYYDVGVRRSVVAAVRFLKTLSYQGLPPDWSRVGLIDMVPWSRQLLDNLMNFIQGLVDAYQEVTKEITEFIDLLKRKIAVIERTIKFVIYILNLIENLSVGFYLLTAYNLTGGVASWFEAIDSSGGDKPPSTGTGGYTAGICLAYLAPSPGGIQAAFSSLFGGGA